MRNNLSPTEAAEINKAATEQNRIAKATEEQAAQRMTEDQAWYEFQLKYTGGVAANAGVTAYICEANRRILFEHIKAANRVIDLVSLDEAFLELKDTGKLAEDTHAGHIRKVVKVKDGKTYTVTPNYERKTDLQKSRIAPQAVSSVLNIPKPPVHIPLTREAILKLVNGPDGSTKLRKLIGRDPRGEAAINKILAGQ